MNLLITLAVLIPIIDTLGGNYWFPSKVGVEKTDTGSYVVYKWNRILLFIWRKGYITSAKSYNRDRIIFDFGPFKDAVKLYYEDALEIAEEYAHTSKVKAKKAKLEEVWNSKDFDSKNTKKGENTLLEELGKASVARDEEKVEELLKLYMEIEKNK